MIDRPRVLVTGAFGYLGLAMLQGLAKAHELVAVGRAPRNPAALSVLPPGIGMVIGDVSAAYEQLTERGPFDAVVHLAGGGGPAKISADPMEAMRSNVRATSGLLEVAGNAGVPCLLYASTIAVYGTHRDHGRPYAETDEAKPDDLYGVIKEAAEHVWTALGGGTSLRIANIYGAGAGIDVGLNGAVERFARAAATGGEISIFGEGAQRIDYVHVDDVVAAFAAAIRARGEKAPLPRAINVGGGAPIRIGDLAQTAVACGRALGREASIVRQPAPPGKSWPDRSLSIELAKRTLGWEPRTTYERGMTGLVEMMSKGAST